MNHSGCLNASGEVAVGVNGSTSGTTKNVTIVKTQCINSYFDSVTVVGIATQYVCICSS